MGQRCRNVTELTNVPFGSLSGRLGCRIQKTHHSVIIDSGNSNWEAAIFRTGDTADVLKSAAIVDCEVYT